VNVWLLKRHFRATELAIVGTLVSEALCCSARKGDAVGVNLAIKLFLDATLALFKGLQNPLGGDFGAHGARS